MANLPLGVSRQHYITAVFYGSDLFLPPNQQCQYNRLHNNIIGRKGKQTRDVTELKGVSFASTCFFVCVKQYNVQFLTVGVRCGKLNKNKLAFTYFQVFHSHCHIACESIPGGFCAKLSYYLPATPFLHLGRETVVCICVIR